VATANAGQLEDIARAALASGEEEAALALIEPAAREAGDPRLWQFTGLLQRSLDRHADALRSFAAAAKLAPADESIARGHARVALEAGVEAVELFEHAARLAPANGAVILGLVAAKFATGRGVEAEAQLDRTVDQSPLWIEGHVQLAQLRSMLGMPVPLGASIERALATLPAEERLWAALLDLALISEDFAAADEIAQRARAANVSQSLIAPFEAIAASEQGQIDRADGLLDALGPNARGTIPLWDVRHLLRAQRLDQAISLIDRRLEGDQADQFWPYAALAWRLAGDPRWDWLRADGQLVSSLDLRDRLPPLDELAALLRFLHVANAEFLDQSVRGGTQTDGPLLSRIEPEIQALRSAIVSAVEDYRAQLPAIDPNHPLLSGRRDRRIRFAGSWSVRLKGSGFHANHVHPQGWISSALYVSLPSPAAAHDAPNVGWLKLGEPPVALGLNLEATQLVEPRPGRLVLFPSWMWHGTVPFSEGERLTVAFDVRPPM
jgi:tetratricopeptide (TPR) repeat protein